MGCLLSPAIHGWVKRDLHVGESRQGRKKIGSVQWVHGAFVPDGTGMVCWTGSPSAKVLGYFQVNAGVGKNLRITQHLEVVDEIELIHVAGKFYPAGAAAAMKTLEQLRLARG